MEVFETVLFIAVMAGITWLFPRFTTIPVVGSDSGNILAISRSLIYGDPDLVIQTQAPPLASVAYSLGLAASGWLPLNLIPLIFAYALILGLAWYVHRLSGNYALAAMVLVGFVISPIFWIQNTSLAPYAPFIFLGYAGLYLSCGYLLGKMGPRAGIGGAALLAAALYTFGQGLLFFSVPALCFLILAPNREALGRTFIVYASLLLLVAPWVVWHLLVGGLSGFEDYPLNWLNSNYVDYINAFWGRDYYDTPAEYFSTVFRVLKRDLLPLWTWPLIGLGVVSVGRLYGWRAGVFAVAVLLALSAPVMFRMSPIFARYWYSCLPLLVLLGVAGLAYLVSLLPRREAAFLLSVCAIAAFPIANNAADHAYASAVTRHEIEIQDYEVMAGLIDDSRGIIGRDSRIQSLVPGNALYNNVTLNEDDMVTYLSWPSEHEVAAVFEKHDVGWVLLYNSTGSGNDIQNRWELTYNLWLVEAAGHEPQHFRRIEGSPLVEGVYRGQALTLYRLRPFD
ncbi:MAG TPA: hypothetical protein VFS30_00490 [Dehalococcoidia bacterium]|nr:hypothetical protein [Dehalococcoidia bacterium]